MRRLVPGALVLAALVAGCGPRVDRVLDGTGSTFIAPLMGKWKDRYRTERGVKVTYEGVGSGTGVQRLTGGLFDFACSDAPLSEEQLDQARKLRGEVVHIPLTLSAVVPAYSLEGVKGPLTLSGPVLADIFLGTVTRWDDPAVRALNPGVSLPDREIVVVHRADRSGTTYIWTDYLSKVSPAWKDRVGVGPSVAWPVGVAEMGNRSVAERVKATPGGLGYVPLSYARQSDLTAALVKNREGVAVPADPGSVTAAAEACLAQIPDDLRYSITDAPGRGSYPIAGTSWAVVFVDQPRDKGRALADFLRWATHEGQEDAEALHYARLPRGLVERLEKKLDRVDGAR
jgi:phosphate transport system substrate-binding protein